MTQTQHHLRPARRFHRAKADVKGRAQLTRQARRAAREKPLALATAGTAVGAVLTGVVVTSRRAGDHR